MARFHPLFSSCFGIGYIKGGGTLAAIACSLVWYLCLAGKPVQYLLPALVTAIIIVVGVWSADEMEPSWGEDSSRVVIDEVAGMCITLLFIPVRWQTVVTGLVLFRFFDIVKPLYVRKMENFKGGWGVMLDDVLAGVYANLILHIILLTGL